MDQQRSQITKVGCRRLCAFHSERVVGCVAEQGYQRPRDFLPQLQHHLTALSTADVAGPVETDPAPGEERGRQDAAVQEATEFVRRLQPFPYRVRNIDVTPFGNREDSLSAYGSL